MKYRGTIDGIAIPDNLIKSVLTSEVSLSFAGSKLISSSSTIELSNHNYIFDDRHGTGGIFEDEDWYNWIVDIYDDETDELVWEGRLKKIEIDDGKMVTIITVNDYIQDLVDTVCIINLLNVTIAEAIWAILTDPDYLAIPEERLIKSGFEIGISQQQDTKINITYTAQNNQKCISVLEELCRVSVSYIFQKDNKIGYWVWVEYAGVIGTPIYDDDITPGCYKQYTDDSEITNEYSIAWNNGGVVAYATGTDTASSAKYGAGKLFAMPSDTVTETNSSAFTILYVSQSSADMIGSKILARNKNIKKKCSIQIGYHFNFISIGEILDLRFSPFTREPVRIIAYKISRDKRYIDVTCEYVNYPEVISLDLTAPDPVQMFETLYFEGSVLLRWSNCNKSDLMMYKLYFSTSAGYWGNEFNHGRFSPVSIPVSNISYIDGDCFYQLNNVDPGKTYYFRVSAVDSSYNEGGRSNVVSIDVPASAVGNYENRYNLAGNPYQGFTLSMTNPGAGTGLAEWAEYDTAEFDTAVFAPSAVYESAVIRKSAGFNALVFRSIGDTGDVMIQYRVYAAGTFGAWSTLSDTFSASNIDLQGNEYIQYRVIFNSPNWADTDKFMIKEVA